MKGQGTFIPDIPFFEDYILFIRCKHEAKAIGDSNTRFYIVRAVQEYINGKNNTIDKLNTEERFHIACKKQAKIEGLLVSQLIEKICADKLGEVYRTANINQPVESKKNSWFDLNRDVRK